MNLVTRDGFRGVEATLYTATTQRGDGTTYDASVIAGHPTDDGRAHITIAADIESQHRVFAAERGFSSRALGFDYRARTPFVAGSPSSGTVRIGPDRRVHARTRRRRAGAAPGDVRAA